MLKKKNPPILHSMAVTQSTFIRAHFLENTWTNKYQVKLNILFQKNKIEIHGRDIFVHDQLITIKGKLKKLFLIKYSQIFSNFLSSLLFWARFHSTLIYFHFKFQKAYQIYLIFFQIEKKKFDNLKINWI